MADAFEEQIERASQRVNELLRASETHPGQPRLLSEALTELAIVIEELRVAGEELHAQNEELLASREIIEAERQRYQDLFEAAPDGYLVTDAQGSIREANLAAATLFGRSLLADSHKPIQALAAPDSVHAVRDALNGLRQGKTVTGLEVSLLAADRQPFSAVLTLAPIRDPYGKLAEVRWTIRDITERKRAEEALRESEERFRTVQENSLDRFSILKPIFNERGDIADFTYVYHNAQASRIVGRRPDEMKGRRVSDIFPSFSNSRFFAMYKQVIETGQTLEIEDRYNFDGVDEWFRATVTPVPDGIAIAAQSITERKRAEEALRESEEQFRRAILDAPIPIIMHAEDGEVLQISRTWTEMTGYTLHDMPTLDAWLNRAYGEGADAVRDHVHALFTGDQRSIAVEFPIRTCDGQIRYWSFSASAPGTLRDGRRFVVGMAVDITERKHYEEMLLEADRTKDEFLAMLSHELQTPLTSILGWSSVALRKGTPEMLAEAMPVVYRNAVRQKRLVDDLLEMSRLLHHKIQLKSEQIDLSAQATHAVENIRLHSEERQLHLAFAPASEPLPILADPARIQQCLGNLLSNSVKFTPHGGTITVRCWRDGDQAICSVEDTGRGIRPEALPTLFQAFRQVDRNEQYGGLGLGLAVTHGIITLHNGNITAESDGPDCGSRFTIMLPIANTEISG